MSTHNIDYIFLNYPSDSDSDLKADYVALWEPDEYSTSVRIWSAISVESQDGTTETFAFEPWPKEPIPVLEAKNPEIFAVFKWDGCADIDLSPSGGMWHVCNIESIQNLHRLLTWLHTRAPSFIGCVI